MQARAAACSRRPCRGASVPTCRRAWAALLSTPAYALRRWILTHSEEGSWPTLLAAGCRARVRCGGFTWPQTARCTSSPPSPRVPLATLSPSNPTRCEHLRRRPRGRAPGGSFCGARCRGPPRARGGPATCSRTSPHPSARTQSSCRPPAPARAVGVCDHNCNADCGAGPASWTGCLDMLR